MNPAAPPSSPEEPTPEESPQRVRTQESSPEESSLAESGPESSAEESGAQPQAEPGPAPEEADGSSLEEPPEEIWVNPRDVRRRPRYGRFIVAGLLLGALVGAILAQFGALQLLPGEGSPSYTRSQLLVVLAGSLAPVGALVGAVTALVLDKRANR